MTDCCCIECKPLEADDERTKMLAAIYRLGYSNGWYDATGGEPFNDDIGDVSVMEMLAHEEMTESDPCPICGVTESHICHGAG